MKIFKIRRILLYIFFFCINFEIWDPFQSGIFSISKFFGILYFLSIAPDIFYFLSLKKKGYFFIPLLCFFLILTINSFININLISSYFFDFSLFQNILLLVILINHARKDNLVLEKAMLSFAMGSLVFALFYFANIGVEYDGGRVSVFGDNENSIGIRMCISIIYLFYITLNNPLKFGKIRWLFLLSIPFMVGLMGATASRVSFISFILCFSCFTFMYKTRKFYIKLLILLNGCIIGFFLINYILSSELMYNRLINSAEEHDLAGRDEIWKSVLPIISDNPSFGLGITGYSLFTYKIYGKFASPHNVFIEILCYTGVFGFIAFLFFLLIVVQKSYEKFKYDKSVIYLILLIPIFGLILSGQILDTKISWVIFAFGLSETYRIKKNKNV